jgi:hypothetical protein
VVFWYVTTYFNSLSKSICYYASSMHLLVGSIPFTEPIPNLAKLSAKIPAPHPMSRTLNVLKCYSDATDGLVS